MFRLYANILVDKDLWSHETGPSSNGYQSFQNILVLYIYLKIKVYTELGHIFHNMDCQPISCEFFMEVWHNFRECYFVYFNILWATINDFRWDYLFRSFVILKTGPWNCSSYVITSFLFIWLHNQACYIPINPYLFIQLSFSVLFSL